MSRDATVVGTTALITDVERRKALPLIRALGREGVRVIGLSASRAPLGAFSRYCDRVVRCPDYMVAPQEFADWLGAFVQEHDVDVLYPIEDRSLEICVQTWDKLSPYVKGVLPRPDVMERVYDKWNTIQAARNADVHVPVSYCPANDYEAVSVCKRLTAPVVIKPRKSSGSRGLEFVDDPDDVLEAYRRVADVYPRPIIQERLPPEGEGLGVFALMGFDREPVAVFGHRRLREYPITGGPSTLRESYRDNDLIEQSLRLLKSLDMTGVAMVEFKVDVRTKQPVLMEINPRFWGSLQLPVLAGINFPVLYHRLALGLEIQPILEYESGILCRWLWPGDLLHFISNPRRFNLTPSFFQFRGMGYDILSIDDPLPALGMALEMVRKLLAGRR